MCSTFLIKNIDEVIDMFTNHIEINDGYEITQKDINNQFVICRLELVCCFLFPWDGAHEHGRWFKI